MLDSPQRVALSISCTSSRDTSLHNAESKVPWTRPCDWSRKRWSDVINWLGTIVLTIVSFALGLWLPLTNNQQKMDDAGRIPWGRISAIIGYLYFCAWTASFYPQILLNWSEQSVEGLSTDYQMLNLFGFAFYSLFTCMCYYSPSVINEYRNAHGTDPPVESNDVFFCIHALALTVLTIIQIPIYSSKGIWKTMSRWCRILSPMMTVLPIIYFVICLVHTYTGKTYVKCLSWLTFINVLAQVKLAISICKYIPQAVLNHQRRSTVGWSITNVLLDFVGGILSCAQLLMGAIITGNWSDLSGNPVKLGLGSVSILFDIFFILQHYVFYKSKPVSADAVSKIVDTSTVNFVVSKQLNPNDRNIATPKRIKQPLLLSSV